jgi:TetR/AcrR family transcriptional repressor of mexJK operon
MTRRRPPRLPEGAAPARSVGRPKDAGKRAAILQAAKDLFVARGYEATSMEAVAEAAGVSKLTLYSHFGDKLRLFREAVRAVAEGYLPHEVFVARGRSGLRRHLERVAQAFIALVTSPESIAANRMLAADASVAGEIGPIYFEAGPARVRRECAAMLAELDRGGELAIPDPDRAAQHLLVLLKGEFVDRAVWGCGRGNGEPDVDRHIASVLDLFLAAYARR